jgi:hypothetical protein
MLREIKYGHACESINLKFVYKVRINIVDSSLIVGDVNVELLQPSYTS